MILLSTPVGTLFPLALLLILGGTLFIGILASRQARKREIEEREKAYRDMIKRNSFKRVNKKKNTSKVSE